MPRNIGRFLAVAAAEGIIGYGAIESIKATVTPGVWRDAVLLAIWPLVIVAGTIAFVVWIWRGDGPGAAPLLPQGKGDPVSAGIASAPAATAVVPVVLPIAQPKERVFVPRSVTPLYLSTFFEGHTDAEGKRSVTEYMGKWISVRAPVSNVQVFDSFAIIHFYLDMPTDSKAQLNFHVTADFAEKWKERVGLLRVDEEVLVVGRIQTISKWQLQLMDSELLG